MREHDARARGAGAGLCTDAAHAFAGRTIKPGAAGAQAGKGASGKPSSSGPSTTRSIGLVHMDGKEVYRHAVTRMIETANKALEKAGRKPTDLTLLIPHQANLRIIESIAKRMHIPMEKVFLNIHKYGNMSAATLRPDFVVNSSKIAPRSPPTSANR